MAKIKRKQLRAVIVLAAALLAGCGGGGGGGAAPAAFDTVNAPPASAPLPPPGSGGSFTFTSDSYGMQNATFLSATQSGNGLVMRAAVASSITDPDYRTVSRIDIPSAGSVSAGTVYTLGAASGGASFPGALYFFNGHQSTLLQTVGGTITFTSYGTSTGDLIAGSFSARILDGGDSAVPKGSYTIAANFSFVAGGAGQVLPLTVAVPAAAPAIYGANCASCHSLGDLDPSAGTGPELALKGGKLDALFPDGAAGHKGITLAGAELSALKVLLNVN